MHIRVTRLLVTVAALLAVGLAACGGDDEGASDEAESVSEETSVAVDGETAYVQDCFVDTTEQFDAATGESLGGESTTTMHVDVELQRIDGVWKVAERTERGDPCPAA